MARLARVVAIGTPHHVTQRGNDRRWVFETDADRLVYLQLLQLNCQAHDLSVLGFCLMSNHVHLVVIPRHPDSMALALRHAHGRYASYLNARAATSGHVWQGRFYSCPLDADHLWTALRYTELNPVRAGMVADPTLYPWSSAAAHCGHAFRPLPLDLAQQPWRECWSPVAWRGFLDDSEARQDIPALRANTHTGRPLGASEFVNSLEQILGLAGARQRWTPAQATAPCCTVAYAF
jgi:putative transposase